MILIFHSLYFLLRHLIKSYTSTKAIHEFYKFRLYQQSEVSTSNTCHYDAEHSIRFDPPVFKQRYVAVQQVLLHDKWRSQVKKVVDFGCSEMKFFQFLKQLMGVTEINCVDIDEDVLTDNLFRIRPLTVDYLKRRCDPLKVQILCGSISEPDFRLKGTHAVIAIEVIEHLYPDTLEAMPYNIFHHIEPLLAIFTTPNADFNVLFPDPLKFRHDDHKFEWTREQFESWALNITVRFPKYKVLFDGIGNGPEERKSIGCCSQMAIFLRKEEVTEVLSEVPKSCRQIATLKKNHCKHENLMQSYGICTYYSYSKQVQMFGDNSSENINDCYKIIDTVEYPYEIDIRSSDEKVLDEVTYRIYSAARRSSRFYNEEKDRVEIPLYELTSNEEGSFTTVNEVRKLILQKGTFIIEECVVFGNDKKVLCVVYDFNMDNRSSTPSSDGTNDNEETNITIPWQLPPEEADWDAEYTNVAATNEAAKPDRSEEIITYQHHSSLPNTSIDVKDDRNVKKDQPKSKGTLHKVQSSSSGHMPKHTPKKGTNVKNPNTSHNISQGTSKENEVHKRSTKKPPETSKSNLESDNKKLIKKNFDIKIIDSSHTHEQDQSVSKSSSKHVKSSIVVSTKNKSKVITSSPKKSSTKLDDAFPSTSNFKKKKAMKITTEEDIGNLTASIVYNSLNKVQERDEIDCQGDAEDEQVVINAQPIVENGDLANNNRDLEGNNYPDDPPQQAAANEVNANENVQAEIINEDFQNRNENAAQREEIVEAVQEVPCGHELNHASREALFDPNSEVDMLEEFEIISGPSVDVDHDSRHSVVLIGLNINSNEEENVVLPENADPFPNWLLQLLGANVEDGDTHDEPHFYCQGDGIGVHPSIVEVEIDEEESSDSSSSNDEAVAELTLSEPAVALPNDDAVSIEITQEEALSVIGRVVLPEPRPLPTITPPGSTSNAESADEFFDTMDESLLLNDSPCSTAQGVNKQE